MNKERKPRVVNQRRVSDVLHNLRASADNRGPIVCGKAATQTNERCGAPYVTDCIRRSDNTT